MKRLTASKLGYRLLVIIMAFVMVISWSTSALAATRSTGIYLGSGNVYKFSGDVDYDVRGYVYYNANTSTYIDVNSMVQWIYNYGEYNVDQARFEAHDGEFNNYNITEGLINITGVEPGDNVRLEADWESICRLDGKSTIYQKNNNDVYAYTNMVSGNSYAGLGGWASYWFPTTREDLFHY